MSNLYETEILSKPLSIIVFLQNRVAIFFQLYPLPVDISASNWATELIKRLKESSWPTYMRRIHFPNLYQS